MVKHHRIAPMLIVRRWVEVFGLAAVGASIVAITLPMITGRAPSLETGLHLLLPIGVVASGVLFHGARDRFDGFFGLHHLFTYPPSWFAAVLGFNILLVYGLCEPAWSASIGWSMDEQAWIQALTASTIIGGTSVWVAHLASFPKPVRSTPAVMDGSSERSRPSLEDLSREPAKLFAWLRDDRPIDNHKDDLFDATPIADRIVARIAATSDPEAVSIVLVGDLGSGKSTVLSLARTQLTTDGAIGQTVLLVDVTLWPYGSPETAIRGVLDRLTTELGKRANIASVAGLADAYLAVIEAPVRALRMDFSKLLRTSSEPSKVLKGYDTLAAHLGLRIVLWVEDLERFSGTALETPADQTKRIEAVRALLFLLSQQPNIAVVFSTSNLMLSSADTRAKIARYSEYIAPLQPERVWRVLSNFRRALRRAHPCIDAATPTQRQNVGLGKADEDAPEVPAELRTDSEGLTPQQLAICILTNNPRRLKMALRRMQQVWGSLAGEIDFDDMFVMSVLAEAEPEVFELLAANVRSLQSLRFSKPDSSHFAAALDKIRSESSDRGRAIRHLIELVFPGWKDEKGKAPGELRPQGLARGNADYWERFVAQSKNRRSDQGILRAIREATTGDDGILAELMTDDDVSDAVERFAMHIDDESLLRLLVTVCRVESKLPASSWSGKSDFNDGTPPAIAAVWRMMLKRHGHWPDVELVAALKRAIDTSVSQNLTAAFAVIHLFATPDSQVPGLIGDPLKRDVADYYRQKIAGTFAEEPAKLALALHGAPQHILRWSVWGLDVVRSGATVGTPAHWERLRPVILGALLANPKVMVPQVLTFVVRYEDTFLKLAEADLVRQVRYVANLNESLFGDSLKEAFAAIYEREDFEEIRQSLSQRQAGEWQTVLKGMAAKTQLEEA